MLKCESCKAPDKGLHKIVQDRYSEETRTYMCNERCPEQFETISDALQHLIDDHPPSSQSSYMDMLDVEDPDILNEGHEGFATSWSIRVKEDFATKMCFENGVYKCKFVCLRKFSHPCELWVHLTGRVKSSIEQQWHHWPNPDKDVMCCGVGDDLHRSDLNETEPNCEWPNIEYTLILHISRAPLI